MSEVLLAIIATVLVILGLAASWTIGLVMGKMSTNTGEWLEENGCYLCQEKYRDEDPFLELGA